ncbi:hypothetical protein UFOVP48_89 [uncultured Caudovirales phage]|uniref:Uncharacterized protein n=1 Tax=uncultured Caudovirales phage TaxID=2100421 RepID=A0A6J5KUC8_9CAUD|nr:hypothetical protein UFOVP48_89 [uncultured Caudovirales phage]
MTETIRKSRESETRAATMRPAKWMPPQLLPDPTPEDGYAFRWIRTSTLNKDDPTNVSSKLREGWEPVKASDHPEIRLFGASSGNFPDSIVVGGLMLCKTPVEFIEQRDAYFRQQAEGQMSSVDNTYMRENDPRMPMFKERSTKVTFGKGI